jgi:hypothetical protein
VSEPTLKPESPLAPLSLRKASTDTPYLTPLRAANSANVVKRLCIRKIELIAAKVRTVDKLRIARPIPRGAMEPESPQLRNQTFLIFESLRKR